MTELLWIVVLVLGAIAVLVGLALYPFTRPVGRTLQERYPAAPGVPTFTYSSVDLPEEAFVKEPRRYLPPPVTVTLTSTPHEVYVRTEEGQRVVARVWDGATASGLRVHAYVVDVRVVYQGDEAAFAREFGENAP